MQELRTAKFLARLKKLGAATGSPQRSRNSSLCYRSEVGASMLEFSLIALLFFVLMLTFIDLSRYFMLKATLIAGAQRGLGLAQKLEGFEIDIERLAADDAESPEKLEKFRQARTRIAEVSQALPLRNIAYPIAEHSHAPIRLHYYRPVDVYAGQFIADPEPIYALILRPGDSSRALEGDDILNHFSRCSGLLADCPTARNGSDTMERMLRDFPIAIELSADFETYSPFLPDLVVRGRAYGWREQAAGLGFRNSINASGTTTAVVERPPVQVNPNNDCPDPGCPSGTTWADWLCSCITSGGN